MFTRRSRGNSRRRGGLAGLTAVVGGLVIFGPAVPAAQAAPATLTFSYAGPDVSIPDAADLSGTLPGSPATAAVVASGLTGEVTDVDFSIDGTACDAVAASPTAGIAHTFVNDLEIKLTSPDGTTVTLIDNTDGSGNNLCQVVLDDESVGPSIQTVVTASAPFTGSYLPANALSAFDGENPNGNWTVAVQDFFMADTGVLRAFSVVVTAEATADVASNKTVAGDFAEGGTVTYTITNTNSGNSTSADNPGDEFTDVLPAGLSLVSASATSGTAVATVGTNSVTWNGSLPAAGSVTITITATVNAGTQNQVVSNQGSLSFDGDVNGTNESSALTDDPAGGGAADPTDFTVGNITPTVTIVQALGQGDPTSAQPVHFTATFSETVTGFDETDVVVAGAAGATTVVVSGTGPVYDIAVSGALGFGAIIVSIPAGAVVDTSDTPNLASTSSDDTVTLDPVPTTSTTTTTTAPRGLPATGARSSGLPLGVAIAALVAGAVMVFTSRRRPHHSR